MLARFIRSCQPTHNRNTTTSKYESAVVRSTQNCVHIAIKLSIYTRKRYFYISHFSAASRSLESYGKIFLFKPKPYRPNPFQSPSRLYGKSSITTIIRLHPIWSPTNNVTCHAISLHRVMTSTPTPHHHTSHPPPHERCPQPPHPPPHHNPPTSSAATNHPSTPSASSAGTRSSQPPTPPESASSGALARVARSPCGQLTTPPSSLYQNGDPKTEVIVG
jgi:hypothetical protein